MRLPETLPAQGETQENDRPRPSAQAKPFYDFILGEGRELKDEEIYPNYYIISGDVRVFGDRIEEFNRNNPGTKAEVLTLVYGEKIPDNFLIACDPAGELLVVVQQNDD